MIDISALIKKEEKELLKNPILPPSTGNSFLIGEPIPWSKITEEDNKKEWLWENYIAKKHITLLSALWKSGKTTFLRCLFLAMAKEEEFAGQPTKKCKVLILSEEDKGEWAESRDNVEDADIDNILVWSRPVTGKPTMKIWETFVSEITNRCIKDQIDLIVIDTLTTFWPIDNENDSAQVTKALIPLFNLTRNNIAVLLVHHFRKGGGDEAQASRGSGALTSFVDNIIEFTRNKEGFPNQRILKSYGRFSASEEGIVIEYGENGKYITKGEPWQVSKSARLEKILNIFENSKEGLSSQQVFNIWSSTIRGLSKRSISRYVKELLDFGYLVKTREETVMGKIIPIYARNEEKKLTHDNFEPLSLIPVMANETRENPVMATVMANHKNSLGSHDMTSTSVIPEQKLSKENKNDVTDADWWNE